MESVGRTDRDRSPRRGISAERGSYRLTLAPTTPPSFAISARRSAGRSSENRGPDVLSVACSISPAAEGSASARSIGADEPSSCRSLSPTSSCFWARSAQSRLGHRRTCLASARAVIACAFSVASRRTISSVRCGASARSRTAHTHIDLRPAIEDPARILAHRKCSVVAEAQTWRSSRRKSRIEATLTEIEDAAASRGDRARCRRQVRCGAVQRPGNAMAKRCTARCQCSARASRPCAKAVARDAEPKSHGKPVTVHRWRLAQLLTVLHLGRRLGRCGIVADRIVRPAEHAKPSARVSTTRRVVTHSVASSAGVLALTLESVGTASSDAKRSSSSVRRHGENERRGVR